MAKRKRRRFTPEFKAEVVLEALRGEVPKRNCVGTTTSAKINSQSGSSKSLKMWHLCLPRRINAPARRPSALRNLNSSLDG